MWQQIQAWFKLDKQRDWWVDGLLFLTLVIASIAVWWPSRYNPYWWESASQWVPSITALIESGWWPPFLNGFSYPQTPLFAYLVGLLWRFFGESKLISHLVMLPFLPLYCMGVYYLSREFVRRHLAMVAAWLVFATPFVLGISLRLLPELPAATLALFGVVAYLAKRYGYAVVLWVIAVLLSQSVLLSLIPLLLWFGYSQIGAKKPAVDQVGLWVLLLPFLVFVAWSSLWWGMSGEAVLGLNNLLTNEIVQLNSNFWLGVQQKAIVLFGLQSRVVLSILGVGGLIYLSSSKSLKLLPNFQRIALIGASLIITWLFLSLLQVNSLKYFLPVYPFFVIATVWVWQQLTARLSLDWRWDFALVVPLGLMILAWHPLSDITNYQFVRAEDLTTIDLVYTFRRAGAYAQTQRPDGIFYGGYPENILFTQPIQGYVTKPLSMQLCQDFTYDNEADQLVFIHPYSVSQVPCRQLLTDYTLEPLSRFSEGGQWVELYEVVASESAEEAPSSAEILQ